MALRFGSQCLLTDLLWTSLCGDSSRQWSFPYIREPWKSWKITFVMQVKLLPICAEMPSSPSKSDWKKALILVAPTSNNDVCFWVFSCISNANKWFECLDIFIILKFQKWMFRNKLEIYKNVNVFQINWLEMVTFLLLLYSKKYLQRNVTISNAQNIKFPLLLKGFI